MHCDQLPHGNLPPHLLLMGCVLRYMLVTASVKSKSEGPVLRKPELDAFLATAMSPELRNVAFLAEMRLEMVTIRGVHLAALFMQGIEMALLANDACGCPIPVQMCLPWTFFDGKLFHSKLIRATQARNLIELCDGRVEMAYQIERVREMIMTGQASVLPVRMSQQAHPPHQQLWKPGMPVSKPKQNAQKKKNKKQVRIQECNAQWNVSQGFVSL